jgi:nitrogenase molybdenum-iron protein alpha/beta subunit
MGRTNRILPVYTGDVSGACSALFELGGMVVIHDPSGCNSTYNTHDETRWYDHNSLIFISGLVERDAILGNDDKFVNDVVDAAIELKPRFVALCNSPIPYITGTDFVAISKMIERRTGIPCFYVRTNGMHDYTVGAGNAFARIAEHFVDAQPRRNGTLNVLGMTPLDYCDAAVADDLHGFAQAAGFEVVSCWAMGSDLDEIRRAAQASINLVVSSTGLKAAHVLRERFGTPYVVGMPYAGFDAVIASALDSAARPVTVRILVETRARQTLRVTSASWASPWPPDRVRRCWRRSMDPYGWYARSRRRRRSCRKPTCARMGKTRWRRP